MTEILRSWQCLNSRCEAAFDAWDANPSCPHCGNVRVNWIPGGGHVAGTARQCDADLRALADVFRMTDINSAVRDQRAKPSVSQPGEQKGQPTVFAPGFAAVPHPERAMCVPSTTPVNFKAKVTAGQALSPNKMYPRVQSNTAIEARHVPVTK